MSDRTWHTGNPPHVGWWNASIFRAGGAWRWWNGKHWSLVVYDNFDLEYAARRATLKNTDKKAIEWSNYYPANARVPRVNPNE